jgi:hypothetical protein
VSTVYSLYQHRPVLGSDALSKNGVASELIVYLILISHRFASHIVSAMKIPGFVVFSRSK